MLIAIPLIIGSYFWGAVPTAYLVARYSKGIDIRDFGSGNVGATNVMTHIGWWHGFLQGTFDCLAKGALPVVLAQLLDQSLTVQAASGLVAIAGHNWSPYIGFTGGRGVATAIGVLLGSMMWPEFFVVTLVLGGIGRVLFKDTGLWTFISLLALPILAYLVDRPPEFIWMTIGIGVLLISKRLTANWEPPTSEYALPKVLLYRVLWDRDVPKKVQWTGRSPRRENGRSSNDIGDEVLL